MPISQYLHRKYGFHPNADVPAEFLCEELLLTEAEVIPLLKRLLPRGHWRRETMLFSMFCAIVDEVLNR